MLTVSNYHYIREDFNTPFPSIFGVTKEAFKSQLIKLQNTGDYISNSEFINNREEILASKNNYLLITFDDGLKEQINNALPILDELSIPAVFFANSLNYHEKEVSTVHKIHLLRSIVSPKKLLIDIRAHYPKIDQLLISEKPKAIACYRFDNQDSAVLKYILNFSISFKEVNRIIDIIFKNYFSTLEILDSLYMGKEDLKYLADNSYLGSHSHSHFPLGKLDKKEMLFEMEFTKKYFEDLTGSKIESISYPYGTPEACSKEVLKLAKEIGYKCGFSTTKGINNTDSNPLLLDRFDCNDLIGGKNYKI